MTGTIISSGMSALTSALGGIWGYVGLAAVCLAIGTYGGYRLEYGTYEAEVAHVQAAATNAAIEQRKSDDAQAGVNTTAAITHAQADFTIQAPHITLKTEIAHETPKLPACVGLSVLLARELRAASAGTDLAAQPLTPGQSDDDCSDVTVAEVAGWFNAYSEAAQRNTQQLTDLQAWVLQNHAAQETAK